MKRACLIATIAAAAAGTGCSGFNSPSENAASTHASAPEVMIHYGCPTCHVIPRVPGAVGKVGPSLESLAQRSYLAGTLQNTPENLVRWIEHPQQIHPGTAMPEMGVTSADAVRIAAFLQSNQ